MIRSRTRALLAAALTLAAMAVAAGPATPAQADWTPDWSALPPCHSETNPIGCTQVGYCLDNPSRCVYQCDHVDLERPQDCVYVRVEDPCLPPPDEYGEPRCPVTGVAENIQIAIDLVVETGGGAAGTALGVAGGAAQTVLDLARPIQEALEEGKCVDLPEPFTEICAG